MVVYGGYSGGEKWLWWLEWWREVVMVEERSGERLLWWKEWWRKVVTVGEERRERGKNFWLFLCIFLWKKIECEILTMGLTYIGDERDAWTNGEMPHSTLR